MLAWVILATYRKSVRVRNTPTAQSAMRALALH
uniref:Uncharacterized protein n=1 Tax=Siphoviridae sp. ctAxs8 TaxID=2825372 RepID=A0A8S5PQH1_9CAUD|nr:MAG TPA: hypothetical protein [Siphoviridae sp. ctAxs8]